MLSQYRNFSKAEFPVILHDSITRKRATQRPALTIHRCCAFTRPFFTRRHLPHAPAPSSLNPPVPARSPYPFRGTK